MTLRYIGSKSRLGEELSQFMGRPDGGRFIDAFCGMGSVAAQAADLGWPILLNDHLAYAVTMSAARLTAEADAQFRSLGGYESALAALNVLPGRFGFIWREYSPAAARESAAKLERRYFTEHNAAKIDACRTQIFDWRRQGHLSPAEEQLLIADLLSAANRVANIAGTYGCFLATWTSQGRGELELRPRALRQVPVAVESVTADVRELVVLPTDTVYLDPPYTKRQYASYYHILETITLGDAPRVEGVAGLRPWKHLASDYCYKRRALTALDELIRSLPAQRILLSYSSEGHVDLEELQSVLNGVGRVTLETLGQIGRYRPNQTASDARSSVEEYLMVIEREVQPRRAKSGAR